MHGKIQNTCQKWQKELKMSESKANTKDSAIQLADPELLKDFAGMGMKQVDPTDIRPPQILLVQKMSDTEQMMSVDGMVPKLGQFYHTGKRTIMDEFDAYFIYASKGTFIDTRKTDKPVLPQYSVVGMLQDDLSMFGMLLRGSSLWALNSLFSVSVSEGYPMFAFKCHVENKKLSNDKGEWWIPVVRVGELETDNAKLDMLFKAAKQLDEKSSIDLEANEVFGDE